ncbi:hypothetical protein [Cuspidothrix issatschenkoi]|uniref:Uncharacterized protein n=1 Tax=Cuspidothrix issatschenkoi CHARLIE-1 TaxID=2052836 RepID=A0A2S6CZT5_9CYAN|nr:hypothetical protein [Cuspidothrix issatschenkoi]PPJ65256.1 hypothetical protein CUN59_00375 [Cuspidothrix issatschenkoi CHARLIE-1]
MAKKISKAEAWQLFKKGLAVGDVEKLTATPRRTLYNWFASYEKEYGLDSKKEEEEEVKRVKQDIKQVQILTENQVKTELEGIDFDSGWVDFATRKALEGCLVNGAIAQRLSDLMHLEISKSEPNYKNISCISTALNTHYRLQHLFGMFHLLDVNKAVQLLQNAGYTVVASVE